MRGSTQKSLLRKIDEAYSSIDITRLSKQEEIIEMINNSILLKIDERDIFADDLRIELYTSELDEFFTTIRIIKQFLQNFYDEFDLAPTDGNTGADTIKNLNRSRFNALIADIFLESQIGYYMPYQELIAAKDKRQFDDRFAARFAVADDNTNLTESWFFDDKDAEREALRRDIDEIIDNSIIGKKFVNEFETDYCEVELTQQEKQEIFITCSILAVLISELYEIHTHTDKRDIWDLAYSILINKNVQSFRNFCQIINDIINKKPQKAKELIENGYFEAPIKEIQLNETLNKIDVEHLSEADDIIEIINNSILYKIDKREDLTDDLRIKLFKHESEEFFTTINIVKTLIRNYYDKWEKLLYNEHTSFSECVTNFFLETKIGYYIPYEALIVSASKDKFKLRFLAKFCIVDDENGTITESHDTINNDRIQLTNDIIEDSDFEVQQLNIQNELLENKLNESYAHNNDNAEQRQEMRNEIIDVINDSIIAEISSSNSTTRRCLTQKETSEMLVSCKIIAQLIDNLYTLEPKNSGRDYWDVLHDTLEITNVNGQNDRQIAELIYKCWSGFDDIALDYIKNIHFIANRIEKIDEGLAVDVVALRNKYDEILDDCLSYMRDNDIDVLMTRIMRDVNSVGWNKTHPIKITKYEASKLYIICKILWAFAKDLYTTQYQLDPDLCDGDSVIRAMLNAYINDRHELGHTGMRHDIAYTILLNLIESIARLKSIEQSGYFEIVDA